MCTIIDIIIIHNGNKYMGILIRMNILITEKEMVRYSTSIIDRVAPVQVTVYIRTGRWTWCCCLQVSGSGVNHQSQTKSFHSDCSLFLPHQIETRRDHHPRVRCAPVWNWCLQTETAQFHSLLQSPLHFLRVPQREMPCPIPLLSLYQRGLHYWRDKKRIPPGCLQTGMVREPAAAAGLVSLEIIQNWIGKEVFLLPCPRGENGVLHKHSDKLCL